MYEGVCVRVCVRECVRVRVCVREGVCVCVCVKMEWEKRDDNRILSN